ncbi:MAG: metal-dependent transcriptional regulator [bacterium]|nr:metal-dependent transcriptional regulator [bacterium]
MKEKLSPNFEDYIEAVYIIQMKNKVVRVKDISKMLNVSMPSVNGAIKNLKEKNLVMHQKYGYVELTDLGRKTALEVFQKHNLIKNFFMRVLDLPEEISAEDACKIEHYLSKKTMERLSEFINFFEKNSPEVSEQFKNFYKKGHTEK